MLKMHWNKWDLGDMTDQEIATGILVLVGVITYKVIKWWFLGFFNTPICMIFHRDFSVIAAYSNRSHRMKCDKCGREWDD